MGRPKQRIQVQQHYLLLTFSWRVMQGIRNYTPVKLIKKYIAHFYQHCLKDHCRSEEKVFSEALKANESAWQEMITGHKKINTSLETILLRSDTGYADLKELCHLLIEAVRYEEQKLIPYLQQQIPPYQFNETWYKLEKRQNTSLDSFSPAFWLWEEGSIFTPEK